MARELDIKELQKLLQFLDQEVLRKGLFRLGDPGTDQRLREKIRAVCQHKLPNGESAWVPGADSQCSVCHSRD